MPFYNRGACPTNKDDHSNSSTIRKSILRNADVPFKEYSQAGSNVNSGFSDEEIWSIPPKSQGSATNLLQDTDQVHQQKTLDRDCYHEPRVNKLLEMSKNIDDLKRFQEMYAGDSQELAKRTQTIISSKLNFPSHEPVFKNLTKLDEGKVVPSVSRKTYIKTAKKVEEAEISDGIKEQVELMNKLIDLEYEDLEKSRAKSMFRQLSSEEKLLKTNFFSEINYFSSVHDEIKEERFRMDSNELRKYK